MHMKKIKVGIVGYGNLGKGAQLAIRQQSDMELVAIFSRRRPEDFNVLYRDVNVVHMDQIQHYKDKIDVLILCGGSAVDLPEQTPALTKMCNTVDSFDNHANIPEHYANVDTYAPNQQKLSINNDGCT